MNLLFDFTVDKETATIYVTREFAADIDLVWNAFTKPEILDLWSAPKPWRAETKEMDFREGGRWLYGLFAPENFGYWTLVEFTDIQPKSGFSAKNSYCDDKGNPVDMGFSPALCTHSFKSGGGKTTVQMGRKIDSLPELEIFLTKGYENGARKAMDNLDEYFASIGGEK